MFSEQFDPWRYSQYTLLQVWPLNYLRLRSHLSMESLGTPKEAGALHTRRVVIASKVGIRPKNSMQ